MEDPGTLTQAQLRDEAAQLRLIADNVPAMLIAYDKNLHCLFANRRFAEFFGFTSANIVGRHLREIVGAGPYQEIEPYFERVLEGHRTTYERMRVLDGGERRHLEVELIPHLAQDGGTLGLFAVTVDVTERVRAGEQLRESEARYRSMTQLASDVYWEQDAQYRFTVLVGTIPEGRDSENIQSMMGKTRWELGATTALDWSAHRAQLEARRSYRDFEIPRLNSEGKTYWVSVSGEPVFDKHGRFKGYRGVARSITARKQAEQALRDSAENLRLFADNVPAMTVSYDETLHCRFANRRYADFFGFTVDSILGRHLREVVGEAVYREIEVHFSQVLRGHPATYIRTHKAANGETRHLEIKVQPHIGEQGKVLGCFTVATDITEHTLTEERIRRMAHHDSLTGLPNRLLFNDRLDQATSLAKRDSRQFALLYLDLDRFKAVNDTLGHAAGDALPQSVAARIRGEVRESDTVARIGGDEFAVILPDIAGSEGAQTVARKIIAALAPPFRLASQGSIAEIGTSIGIALYPADGLDADALVKAGDAAMYGAKQAGSGFRFFESP